MTKSATRVAADELGIDDNATSTAVTIDASENVGIGVVPKSWSSGFTALEVGNNASLYNESSIATGYTQNAYKKLGADWAYMSTDEASWNEQYNGTHRFLVAPSGTADSAITWTTGFEVLADGKARAKNGLLFGTDTAAANTLDDYEEGTWTPVIQNTTGTFVQSQTFSYVKVGKVVTTRGYIYNGNVASASAIWQFGGLPFQPLRETYGVVQFYQVNIPGDSAWVNVYANPTSSYIRLNSTRDAGTNDWLQWSDVGTGHVDFHLTYLTT